MREIEDRIRQENWERQLRLQKAEDDREERRLKRDAEREIRQIEDENRRRQERNENERRSYIPKLPPYDNKEDIDTYLYRYESYARMMKWNKQEMGSYICSLLQGKALEYYRQIPFEEMHDYDKIKNFLLQRFALSAETYRQKFRNSTYEKGTDFESYIFDISAYYTRWIEMSKVTDMDQLKELLIKEQLLNTLQPDMVRFIKEHSPKDLPSTVALCKNYIEANPSKPYSNNCIPSSSSFAIKKHIPSSDFRHSRQPSHNPQQSRSKYVSSKNPDFKPLSSVTCFNCNRPGHLKKNCHLPPYEQSNRNRSFQTNNRTNFRNNVSRITCYNCKRPGHLESNCRLPPNNQDNQRSFQSNKSYFRNNRSNPVSNSRYNHFSTSNTNSWRRNQAIDLPSSFSNHRRGNNPQQPISEPSTTHSSSDRRPNNSYSVPSFSAIHKLGKLSIHKGYVKGQIVSCLRDTGAACIGVDRSLVDPNEYTGDTIRCQMFSGNVEKLPVARVYIETPFFIGTTHVAVIDNQDAQVIIGTVPGVKDLDESKIYQWYKLHSIPRNAITRSMFKAKNDLKTPTNLSLTNNYGREATRRLQLKDDSLQSNKVFHFSNEQAKFYIDYDLPYRKHTNANEETVNKLVVPQSLRQKF